MLSGETTNTNFIVFGLTRPTDTRTIDLPLTNVHSRYGRLRRGQSKIVNPEKLETYGTQDEEKQSKNTTQYVLDTTIHKQTRIT